MSLWFVIVGAVAAANPPRVAETLSATPLEERARPLTIGVSVLAVVLIALGGLGSQILELLDLTDETWRIAAGAVAVLAGARLVVGRIQPVPELGRSATPLVPVVFPVMLVPELVVLAVLYGATEGLVESLLALAAVIALLWLLGRRAGGPVTRGSARFLAALLVVVGIGLIVAGIRDV